MDDYEDEDEDDEPLPVIPPEDRTMDTPANAGAPDAHEAALKEVWANQGGADVNEARALGHAETILEHVESRDSFGAGYLRLPSGAQSAFEEALAVDPKPARTRDGELNLGPAGAALNAMTENERISPDDRAALKNWMINLSEQDQKAILDHFAGLYR
jgi:hypothetical protein